MPLQSTKRGCWLLSSSRLVGSVLQQGVASQVGTTATICMTGSVDQSLGACGEFPILKYPQSTSERTKLEHFHLVVSQSVVCTHANCFYEPSCNCSWPKICWHSEPLDHLTMEFAYSKPTTTRI